MYQLGDDALQLIMQVKFHGSLGKQKNSVSGEDPFYVVKNAAEI
jgi:hypothetical protein